MEFLVVTLSFILPEIFPLGPILRVPVKPMHYGHPRSAKAVHENPQPFATMPPYLVWFSLDTTLKARHNPRRLAAFWRARQKAALATWGEAHAISAGLDCPVHQSGLCGARALVARALVRSQRRFGILSFVWFRPAGCASAHRSAPAHEAAAPGGPPAPPPSPPLARRPRRRGD